MSLSKLPADIGRWMFPRVTWKLPGRDNEILLTFDDGPVPGATDWILDTLREFEVRAFFFCLGNQVEKYPGLFASLTEEGHRAGNHSYSHPNGWKTGNGNYKRDVMRADKLIRSSWFRPPYGKMRPSQYLWLKKRFSIMMWSFLVPDYDEKFSPDMLREVTEKQLKPGNILVFHDQAYTLSPKREFLRHILRTIKSSGLRTLPPEMIRDVK